MKVNRWVVVDRDGDGRGRPTRNRAKARYDAEVLNDFGLYRPYRAVLVSTWRRMNRARAVRKAGR